MFLVLRPASQDERCARARFFAASMLRRAYIRRAQHDYYCLRFIYYEHEIIPHNFDF